MASVIAAQERINVMTAAWRSAGKYRLETPVAHRLAQNSIDAVAERRLPRRQNADVIADADVGILVDQSGIAAHSSLGQDRIEEHRIHTAKRKIAVGVYVILVGHGHDVVLRL